jgi:DNA replication protein DnaC
MGVLAREVRRAYPFMMARADCPHCEGSGWKVVERTTEGAQALAADRPGAGAGEPKMVWAVPCDCTTGDKTERALQRARVPERYRHCDFENYETDNEHPDPSPLRVESWNRSLAQAKIIVQGFAREFPPADERGLLLMGPCGVGKTHLAVSAMKSIVLRGHSGLFYDYRELLKEIQSSYGTDNSMTEAGVLDPVLKADVLVLDDLGSSKPSPWALETVGHILNTRYNDKRFTLITTNYLDPEFRRGDDQTKSQNSGPRRKDAPPTDDSRSTSVVTLPSGEMISVSREDTLEERIGRRIRSRLYEMCKTIEIHSPDYRKEIFGTPRAEK